jgi:hypothetical protein
LGSFGYLGTNGHGEHWEGSLQLAVLIPGLAGHWEGKAMLFMSCEGYKVISSSVVTYKANNCHRESIPFFKKIIYF